MHGSLDEGLDESEQQEIQKIISEIHGKANAFKVHSLGIMLLCLPA
jgi:hypothetical protein